MRNERSERRPTARTSRQQPRVLERTTAFKKDFRRELAGRFGKTLENDLRAILSRLVRDEPLDRRNVDHPLSGEWKDHRDCHIKPDLVLIYRKLEPDRLQLVRLGSHSELGL